MREKKVISFVGLFLTVLVLTGSPGFEMEGNADKPEALVTIPPQAEWRPLIQWEKKYWKK